MNLDKEAEKAYRKRFVGKDLGAGFPMFKMGFKAFNEDILGN